MTRHTSIDYLRAFSMLYIVGYWHLFDYSSISLGHSIDAIECFTNVVLAIFVFVSGFLMGGKSTRLMSAVQFYKKRLMRIYPLYALALLLFYLYGINSGWVSVKALLGISMYLAPAPLTLWFIAMLVLFYLVTPLLLMLVDNIPVYIAAVTTMLVVTVFIQFAFATVDSRVILYFPSFCLGIFCANHGVTNRLVNPVTMAVSMAIAIALTFVQFKIETLNYIKQIPLVAAGAYLTFYVCWKNEHHFKDIKFVYLLSYSSFAIYLFHRPVYATVKALYFPENPVLQIMYMLMIGLLAAVLIAWSLQKLYDRSYTAVRERLQAEEKYAA